MKAAAIYARVSTASQARDGTSLDTQIEACREFTASKGYAVVKEVREDVTGARLDRAGLDEIRNLAATGQVSAVIVFDVDRLSRSLGHQLLLLEEFERAHVELYFVNTPLEETPGGKMLFAMKGAFAEYERAIIQERTRRGKERRAREGRVMVSWAVPYGYRYTSGSGKLELLDAEALYVKKMFSWLVHEHATLGEIARRLESAGAPTKRSAALGWHRSTVRGILSNETYAGQWHYNKNEGIAPPKHKTDNQPKRVKSSSKPRPREEWIGMAVDAIITGEMYEQAQRQLARNRELGGRRSNRIYILKGMLTCKQCGRRLTGWPQHEGKDAGYRCSGKKVPQLRENCRSPFLYRHLVEGKLWEKVAALLSDGDALMALLEGNEDLKAQEMARDHAELETLYSAQEGLKRERNKLLDLHLADPPLIDRETLQERTSVIDRKQQALAQARAEVVERTHQREEATASRETIERLCPLAQKGLVASPPEEKRQWLEALQLRGTVDGDARRIYFTGVIGDFVLNLAEQKNGEAIDNCTYYARAKQPQRHAEDCPQEGRCRAKDARQYSKHHDRQ